MWRSLPRDRLFQHVLRQGQTSEVSGLRGMPRCHARVEPHEPAIAAGGRRCQRAHIRATSAQTGPCRTSRRRAGLPSVVEPELALRRGLRGANVTGVPRYAMLATPAITHPGRRRSPTRPCCPAALASMRRGALEVARTWAQVQRRATPWPPARAARRTARRARPCRRGTRRRLRRRRRARHQATARA
jgi:hypothetical protein